MRTCGSCSACCTVIAVASLDKPAGTRCRYQDTPDIGAGCSVHGTDKQPVECKRWKCEWLLGWGDDNDRPDISGVVFHVMIPGKGAEEVALPPWAAFPCKPDVSRDTLDKAAQERRVFVVRGKK